MKETNHKEQNSKILRIEDMNFATIYSPNLLSQT